MQKLFLTLYKLWNKTILRFRAKIELTQLKSQQLELNKN